MIEFDATIEQIGLSEETIQFSITPGRAFILMSQLQLALRHPENTGSSAEIVREMIEHLLDAICITLPEVEAAVRNMVEAGWNPAYDLTRGEFDQLYPLNPPDELD